MANNAFELLSKAVPASRTVQQAYAYIQGGQLADTLKAIGDVHLSSAREHLRQAHRSPHARDRVLQASGDLQTAYIAYNQGVARGVASVRRVMAFKKLYEMRGLAASCAGTIALLQWHLGEDADNRRRWLDRVARHASDHWRDGKARDAFARNPVSGFALDVVGYKWDDWGSLASWPEFYIEPLSNYFSLERNLLPEHLVRPRPVGWLPRPERILQGIEYDGSEEQLLPQYSELD